MLFIRCGNFFPSHFHEHRHLSRGRDSSGVLQCMSRCVTSLKTGDFFVKGFWKPYFVLTGLNFLILVSWFCFCSHSFLGNGLKELLQRSLELLCRVDGPCACGLMEGGVTGDLGFWCPSEWPTEGLPHPIVYFQLLSGAFIMDDLCSANPPKIVTFCLFKIMCLLNFGQKFTTIGASCYPAKGNSRACVHLSCLGLFLL